jgi:hypothetical protein
MRLPDNWYSYSLDSIEKMINVLPKPILDKIPRNSVLNNDSTKIRLPMLNSLFDKLCSLLGYYPSQDMYAGYYLAKLDSEVLNYYTAEIYKRSRRNYLSLLREYHFYFLLKEKYPGCQIVFDQEYDLKGIDFIIKDRLGLQLVTITGNNNYLYKKHSNYSKLDIPTILLPIMRSDAKIINGYWLYNDCHLKIIDEFI